MSNLNNQQIISNFNLYLSQNKANNSMRSYNSSLNLIKHLNFITCTQSDLLNWRNQYSQKVCPKTMNQRIVLLNNFFNYLIKVNIRNDNPMILIEHQKEEKNSDKKYELISNDIYKAIYNDPTIHATDKLSVALGQGCGLRVSEASNLRIENIDLENSLLYIKMSKGNKSRTIPIANYVRDMISDYIQMFKISDGYLLRNRCGKQLSAQQINNRFNSIKEKYNLQQSFHYNRHSFATNLVNSPNLSIAVCQEVMGHSNPQTLSIYRHSEVEKSKAQVLSVMDNLF